MSPSHFTEEEITDALEDYRWALSDAIQDLGADSPRDEIINLARELLADENEDHRELVDELAKGEHGDPVWSLEEELIDDEETVASGEDDDDEEESEDDFAD